MQLKLVTQPTFWYRTKHRINMSLPKTHRINDICHHFSLPSLLLLVLFSFDTLSIRSEQTFLARCLPCVYCILFVSIEIYSVLIVFIVLSVGHIVWYYVRMLFEVFGFGYSADVSWYAIRIYRLLLCIVSRIGTEGMKILCTVYSST